MRECQAGTDPGFPVAGGADPTGVGGAPTYDFAKFSKDLHEIEKILGCAPPPPPDPPMSGAEIRVNNVVI